MLLFFSLSLAIPQFGLLSHIRSLRFSSGHSGPVLTLSMQPVPLYPAPARWWQMQVSGLVFHWELQLGTYSLCVCVCVCVCVFHFWLCCPLRYQNSPQTHRWQGFLLFGNFSFRTPSPRWVSVPNSFVSFCLSYFVLLLKRMGCLSGCLVSSASVVLFFFFCQKLFWPTKFLHKNKLIALWVFPCIWLFFFLLPLECSLYHCFHVNYMLWCALAHELLINQSSWRHIICEI